jgi:hypothetical protein
VSLLFAFVEAAMFEFFAIALFAIRADLFGNGLGLVVGARESNISECVPCSFLRRIAFLSVFLTYACPHSFQFAE